MLEQLFGSKTRYRLLRILFQHPEKAFYVRELTRALDTQINAVRREIQLLVDMGVVKELEKQEKTGRDAGSSLRKYYVLDPQSLLYGELQALILKGQIIGEQAFIQSLQKKCGTPRLLLLTGRFTGDTRAMSDMLLVGDIRERALERLIAEYEKDTGVQVRYTVMTPQEFRDRRQMMDKFLYSLFEARHMKVVDTLSA